MYSDTMQRTQVYLGAEELALLDEMSARTGASRSELIRRAIRERYGPREWAVRHAALRASAGVWGTRSQTGAQYVEQRRGDLTVRLGRMGWA